MTLRSDFIHFPSKSITSCRLLAGRAISIWAVVLWSPLIHAQNLPLALPALQSGLHDVTLLTAAAVDRPTLTDPSRQEYQDDPHARRRTLGIIAASSLAVGWYGGTKWWNTGFTGNFRTQREGWFGQNTYSGGADKLGHFYLNYAGTRLFMQAFEWAGNTHDQSLTQAAWLMTGTFTAIEVLDGLSKKWRFSKEDVAMNMLGVGAELLLEKNPDLDRLLDLRVLYRPSNEQGGQFDPFGDYSGQTYLIVAKASGVPALLSHPWLRYVELAVGYGTRGYAEDRFNVSPHRSRNLYFGISLNLSELLGQTAFKQTNGPSRTQRMTETALEFVQVPGSIVFARHKF